MSSGDPLGFFFACSSRLTAVFFFLFFHQILNCLLYLLVHFFLFVFFSISSVFFHFTCHCIKNSLFVIIYMSIVCHKNHNIPCIKEMNSISYL